MDAPGTPLDAAESAILAVEALSRLTLPRPIGQPEWASVVDIAAVVARLQLVAERLPQVLDQIARHLTTGGVLLVADEGGLNPEHLVGDAVAALGAAEHHTAATADALARAHNALGQLSARTGGGAGPR